MDDARQRVQRRTLRLLFATQALGGIGAGIGFSVGALLATEMAGVAFSGLAQSSAVVGAALLAIPATRITQRYGRRPSLTMTYLIAALGAVLVVSSTLLHVAALFFAGLFLFGGATAAGLQARYAAVDLASDRHRGRDLSIIVWATTLGAVTGPNLASVAGDAVGRFGIPTLAGPFVFSAIAFVFAAMLLVLLLRPDPLILARSTGATPGALAAAGRPSGMRWALDVVRGSPQAVLGIASTAIGHVVMVGVMSMTPVHIMHAAYSPSRTLRIVGIVLSFHVAGMYAFAPVTGWLSDQLGRRPVILGGAALLLLACLTAGTAGQNTIQLTAGLMLLGLGWSGTMVGGSTLLSDSIPTDARPSVQGLSDLIMGLAGATAGALSGFAMSSGGYPLVATLTAVAILPLLLLAARRRVVVA